MGVPKKDLIAHLERMYSTLSAKPGHTLEDQTYLFLLADTLFSLTLEGSWDVVADTERGHLDMLLKTGWSAA